MKYIYTFLLGALFFGTVAYAGNSILSADKITPQDYISVSNTSTTTIAIPKNDTILLDTQYTAQGGCIKIKDSDGLGFTYLQTLNGVATFSMVSCE